MMRSNSRAGRHDRSAKAALTAAVVAAILAGCSTQQPSDEVSASGEPRVIRQVDLPLRSAGSEPGVREFADASVRGTLDASGRWRARGEITHPRLRCASYRMGLRFGSGDAACDAVDWQTDATFLPSRMQCNNATVIHSGDGSLGLPKARLNALNCVRVTVQCTGTCG